MEIENSPGKTDPPAPAESSSSMQESSGGEGVGREVLLNREMAISYVTWVLATGDQIARCWLGSVRWYEWRFYSWIVDRHQEFVDGNASLHDFRATRESESFDWICARIMSLPKESGCQLELWLDQMKPDYSPYDVLPDDNVLHDYGGESGWHRIADVYRLCELNREALEEVLDERCALGHRGVLLVPDTLPKRYPKREELWRSVARSKALVVSAFDLDGFVLAVRS